ncbi:phosphotransferase [Actinomadura adrarensis]|uniref:Phosphotransferase n=1 Tax=Actinomadura adrarensis TaxID=1819600 RepID=A0ABW3CAF7_9ACTN
MARPFACVHADVHRKNMIVNDGVTAFLDWEPALWGDPPLRPGRPHRQDAVPTGRARSRHRPVAIAPDTVAKVFQTRTPPPVQGDAHHSRSHRPQRSFEGC